MPDYKKKLAGLERLVIGNHINMLENYIHIWTGHYGIIAQSMMLIWHIVAIPLLSLLVYTAVTGQYRINRSNKN